MPVMKWYLLTERELPEADRYDENICSWKTGVGMLRLLEEECRRRWKPGAETGGRERFLLRTGRLAYPYIARYAREIQKSIQEWR